MNLLSYLDAGGQGSGCHGDKCGRPKGGGTPHTSTDRKRELALMTFKPSTALKQAIADKSEADLSAALKLPRTADNSPFDLVSKKVGVEIKTLIDNKNDKITMHPESRLRKIAAARKAGLRMYTVVIDRRVEGQVRYYAANGVGSFRIGSMKEFKNPAALKKFII